MKRGDIWWIRKQHNGKRIQKPIGKSKRQAEEALRRLEAEIELSDALPERKQITFDRFAVRYSDGESRIEGAGYTYAEEDPGVSV